MKLLYTNAQSVVNKMEELRVLASLKQPDIIAITETWTNGDISNEFLNIDGFELVERKDREDTDRGRGGGVLVYVSKEKCAWREQTGGCFEQHALVKLKGERNDLGIVVVYRSPNSSANNDASLCDLVKDLRGQFCLVGDFNFPGIKWGTGRSDAKGRPFYEEMSSIWLLVRTRI